MSRTHSRTRLLTRGALVAAIALAASACGKSNKQDAVVVTPAPPPVTAPACDTFLEQFGLGFCTAFKAAANTEPREVQANDVVAVDATKEPVAVP